MSSRQQSGRHKGDEKVHVAIRCRPMNEAEKKVRMKTIIDTNIREKEVRVNCNNNQDKTYKFDKVFGPSSKQVDVYRSVVEPHIEEVLAGYNCTVLAYGQTGTGKTFTMEGERSGGDYTWENDPMAGIIPRTLSQLFDRLKRQNSEFSIQISLLEIYNEVIYDLLSPTDETALRRIYDDSSRKGSVIIADLTEVHVLDKSDVYDILVRGAAKRKTHATLLNEFSSRSHSVFTITIHLKEKTKNVDEELVKVGKLNLVDLAGSENIGRSGAVNQRAREAGNINQSLLALGRCITALVDHAPHVPYRESRLTRILQDSLGGSTKTSIIATISPGFDNLDETLSTLDYASRAKNIQNKPQVNQRMVKKTFFKQYDEEIERLRRELFATREKNGVCMDKKQYDQMTEKLEELEATVQERQEELTKYQLLFTDLTEEFRIKSEEYAALEQDFYQTREKLHIQTHLAEVKATHGTKAVKDGIEVVAVADEVTGSIVKVHDKVDRMKTADEENIQTAAEHRERLSDKVGILNGQMKEIVEKNETNLASSIKMLDVISNRNQKEKTQVIEMFQEFQTNLDQSINNCRSTISIAVSEADTKTKAQDEFLSEQEKKMTKAMRKFQEYCTTQMSAMQNKIQASLKVSQDIDSSVIKQMLKQHDMISTHAKSISQNLNKIVQDQKEFEKSHEDEMKDVMEIIKKQLERVSSHGASIRNTVSEIDANVTEFKTESEELRTDYEQESKELLEKQESSLGEIEDCFEESIKRSVEHGENSYTMFSIASGKVENIAANLMEDIRDAEEKIEMITEDASESASTVHSSASDVLEKGVEKCSKDVKMVQGNLDSLSESQDKIINVVKLESDEMKKLTDDFCESGLLHVQPTGATPARKEYSYPKEFKYLPSDDKLIKSFEGMMKLEEEEEEEKRILEEEAAKEVEHSSSAGESSIDSLTEENENAKCGGGVPLFMAEKQQRKNRQKNFNSATSNARSRLPLRATQNIN